MKISSVRVTKTYQIGIDCALERGAYILVLTKR